MHFPSLRDIVDYFVISVLFKLIILQWFVEKTSALMGRIFVRTEKDFIVWTHYRSKAARLGHDSKRPHGCPDGKCPTV